MPLNCCVPEQLVVNPNSCCDPDEFLHTDGFLHGYEFLSNGEEAAADRAVGAQDTCTGSTNVKKVLVEQNIGWHQVVDITKYCQHASPPDKTTYSMTIISYQGISQSACMHKVHMCIMLGLLMQTLP